MHNVLDFIIGPEEDTSPTPIPESSYTPPREMEMTPEPTADRKPVPEGATEYTFDQVCEPAISCIVVGVLVLIEGIELNPAHTPPTVSELLLDSTVISILPQTNPLPPPLQTSACSSTLSPLSPSVPQSPHSASASSGLP